MLNTARFNRIVSANTCLICYKIYHTFIKFKALINPASKASS